MKSWLSLCSGILSLALLCGPAAAQEVEVEGVGKEANPLGDDIATTKILLGPTAAISNNWHTGGFRILDGATCPKFEWGSGWGHMLGLTAELQRSSGWGVIARVTFETRPAHFDEVLPDAKVLPPDQLEPVIQKVTATSDVVYKFINFEAMYSHELFPIGKRARFSVAAGPAVGYVVDARISQYQDLEAPLNAVFLNPDGLEARKNGRQLVYKENEPIPEYRKMRFSLKGGLYAEIGLFHDDWILAPGVYYDYGLSHVTRNENWNLNTLLFQIDIRHAF